MKRVIISVNEQGVATVESDFDVPNTLLLLHKTLLSGVQQAAVTAKEPGIVHAVAVPQINGRHQGK